MISPVLLSLGEGMEVVGAGVAVRARMFSAEIIMVSTFNISKTLKSTTGAAYNYIEFMHTEVNFPRFCTNSLLQYNII